MACLEQFLNPSFFQQLNDSRVGSEWQFVQYYGNNSQKIDLLRNHWNEWIQEEDIKKLGDIGFTHVRIPIGYWAMMTQEELDSSNEYYITGQWPVLTRCVQWLKKYNIKAIIDLHGAPGSQNGWDNSGQLLPWLSPPGWGQGDTVNRTIDILERLAINILGLESNTNTSEVVVGLELLNEAFSWGIQGGLDTVKDYYLRAYPVVRRHLAPEKYMIIIEQAFSPFGWIGFMNTSEYSNVVLDLHIYQCFDDGLRRASYSTHLDVTCEAHKNIVDSQTLPTVVGEWAVAFKMESAIANHEPYPNQEQIEFMTQFALVQMEVFGSHFFWNFKTESAPMWDYFLGVNGGWLPSHLPSPEVNGACSRRNQTSF